MTFRCNTSTGMSWYWSWLLALLIGVGCAPTTPGTGEESGVSKGPSLPWMSSGLKIGYIRSDVITDKFQDYRDSDNALRIDNEQWLIQDEKMSNEVSRKELELEELRLILSDDRRKSLEDELVKLRKRLHKFRQDTWYDENSNYVKRRKELNEPINARVNDAIWKVAEEKGLDLVFDTLSGNIVYANSALDITEAVLEELQN